MENAIQKQEQQEVAIKVNIRSFTLRGDIDEKSPVLDRIREAIRTGAKSVFEQLTNEGILLAHTEQHNLITTRGRNVLARLLTGDATYNGEINYGALGTSSTAVTNADTQLGTETYRKIYASHTTDGANVAYVDFFYAATDCNGTYNEFGNFIAGTGTANSGRIFSHVLTGGWVKSALASLFVSCQYTIN